MSEVDTINIVTNQPAMLPVPAGGEKIEENKSLTNEKDTDYPEKPFEQTLQKKFTASPEHLNEWKKWFMSQKYAINSANAYYSYLKKYIGTGVVITQKRVDGFREANFNSVSSGALKSFFKFLVTRKDFPEGLLLIRFERNRQPRRFPNSISVDEVKLIIEEMGKENLRDKLITVLVYELALRISEAIKLKWEDFNWLEWIKDKTQYGKVNLKNTKRGKFRVLPVKPELMSVLYDNHRQRDNNGIPLGSTLFEGDTKIMEFINNKEQNVELNKHDYIYVFEDLYRKRLNKFSKRAINKKISPHVLRHSKAQHLLDMGVPITTIKELLGHFSLSTTEIYAQASPKVIERDMKIFDNKTVLNNG